MDATKLYRALETDANSYYQKFNRYLELYYYEAELGTIKTLLRRAAKPRPKSPTQEQLAAVESSRRREDSPEPTA